LKDNNSILSPKIFPAKSQDLKKNASVRASYNGSSALGNQDDGSYTSPQMTQGPSIDPKTGALVYPPE